MATSQESFDVVVVGASFAGLSFASSAALLGMRVLVLERDTQVGGVVRTTGVLFSDVFTVLDVPARYLLNAVRRLVIHIPDRPPISVSSEVPRFFMADVTGMLQWMADVACEHGAEVRCHAVFADAKRTTDGAMEVYYQDKITDTPRWITTQFLIGADGTHSMVAKRMGLSANTEILAGAEWIVENVPIEQDTFHLVMDHTLAPGYCLWLAPHGAYAALGVAGHQRRFKPLESLKAAPALFAPYVDLSQLRIIERKGGTIPIGGTVRSVYANNEHGHALLLGDAAGLCGAATGGGIYPALISGRLAAHAIANAVLNKSPDAIRHYLRDLPRTSGLGTYLRIEQWLRRAMNRVQSNADLATLYGVFEAAQGEAYLRRILFETPISSMNGALLTLIRRILWRSSVYGAAASLLWKRILPTLKSVRSTHGADGKYVDNVLP